MNRSPRHPSAPTSPQILAALLAAGLLVLFPVTRANAAPTRSSSNSQAPCMQGGSQTSSTPQTPSRSTTPPTSGTSTPASGTAASLQTPAGTGPGNAPAGNPPTGATPNIPAVDDSAVAPARSEATAAHAELTRAQAALASVVRHLQQAFNAKPDVIDATRRAVAAKTAYDNAARPVLAALLTRSDYAAAVSTATTAGQQVDALKGNPEVSPQERLAAAQSALAARAVVTRFQTDALAASAAVTTAKQELAAANEAIAALRREFHASVKQDPDWTTAKAALDTATAEAAAADQAVATAQQDVKRQQAAQAAALAAARTAPRPR